MTFEQNGRTYGKTIGMFVLVEKSACFLKKNWGGGGNTSGLQNVVSMFVVSVIISLGLTQ